MVQAKLSDLVVSFQEAQAGATLIEWNLASPSGPAGLWEIHTRVEGFVVSQQTPKRYAKIPKTVVTKVDENCIPYMLMHVTPLDTRRTAGLGVGPVSLLPPSSFRARCRPLLAC